MAEIFKRVAAFVGGSEGGCPREWAFNLSGDDAEPFGDEYRLW